MSATPAARAGRIGLAAAALIAATSSPAAPSSEELAHCAMISASEARLACYDALAPRPAAPAAAAGSSAAPATSRPMTAPAPPPAAVAAPAAMAAAAAPATPAPAAVATFGLSEAQLHPNKPVEVPSITAHVASLTEAKYDDVYVTLDNGQTWRFRHGNVLLNAGDQVTIKRASLGSFEMITPARDTLRVYRTH